MTQVQNPSPLPPVPTDPQFARSLARAVERAGGIRPSLATLGLRTLNALYWLAMLGALSLMLAMALDREPPVVVGEREVLNPGGVVAPGESLVIRAPRNRKRSCQLTRQWSVVDATGRRFDYRPQVFEAYAPVGQDRSADGPIIPADARPGRAYFLSTLSWACNPLQRAIDWPIVLAQPPLPFEIAPR